MVKKCIECKGIMYNRDSDTCQSCLLKSGKEIKPVQKKKYVFTWEEYNMLLRSKVKQGKTYEQAKRELALENNISNKRQEEHKLKLEDEEKQLNKAKKPSDKFKDEFEKMIQREKSK